jgi:hypothetical protein
MICCTLGTWGLPHHTRLPLPPWGLQKTTAQKIEPKTFFANERTFLR